MQKISKDVQDLRTPANSGRNSSSLHHFPEWGASRSSAPVSMHLKVISDLMSMDRIEHGWNRLIQADSSPYQTFGWIQAFFHNWSDWIDEMLVFTLADEKGLVAILPCYRVGSKLHLAADEVSPYNDMVAADRETATDLVARASSWMREFRNGCKFHFRMVREGSFVHGALREVMEDEDGWKYMARDSGTSDSFDLKEGVESYLESLSDTGAIRLREAGMFLNQRFPMDRLTVLRGYEMRVNDLANAFEFFARCKAEGAELPELDFQLFCALGEASKDCDLGMQLAFLSNEGEILAVSLGFAMNGGWHEYIRVGADEHASYEPAANLFIRSIERWGREDDLSSCADMSAEIPASGKIKRDHTKLLSLTLKPATRRHRICDRLLGNSDITDADDSEISLAR